MAQPTLLLKGSFDSFSIDDVLDVVGLSRQTMKVVLDDDGRGGEFLVRAGRVIHAEAPPDRGRRAFVNIYREPGQSFAVWQHVEAVGEPIGMLSELIEEAKVLETAPSAPSRTPMLAGSFSDHRLDEVLDVLNMTRQLVEFKVRREDDSSVVMLLKSGRVLACEDLRDSTNGLDAFKSLFKDPGQTFEVTRLDAQHYDELPPELGTLASLAQEARKNDEQDGKKRPGVLFQGAFDNFPLSDVLEALSVTRLTVEMVFHDSEGTRGTFVLKAGQVLAAQALRTGASNREAFHQLMHNPGERFVVVRRPGTPAGQPIGRLRELLSESRIKKTSEPTKAASPSAAKEAKSHGAPSRVTPLRSTSSVPKPPRVSARRASTSSGASSPRPRARTGTGSGSSRAGSTKPPVAPSASTPSSTKAGTSSATSITPLPRKPAAAPPGIEIVLDGTFDKFSIEDVLEVLSLSRQYVALGTLRNGSPLARIVVKSGRLLMASYGSTKDPAEAVKMLLNDPGTEFRVRRLPRYADSDVGSFAELVRDAKKSKSESTVIHLPKPKPPVRPSESLDGIGDEDVDQMFAQIELDGPEASTSSKVPKAERPPRDRASTGGTPVRRPETSGVHSRPQASASTSGSHAGARPERRGGSASRESSPPQRRAESSAAGASPRRDARATSGASPAPSSPNSLDSVVRSLELIERRLRSGTQTGGVHNDDAVTTLRTIDEHIGGLTDSVKDLATHMDKMRDKMVAETRATRMMTIFAQLVTWMGLAFILFQMFRG